MDLIKKIKLFMLEISYPAKFAVCLQLEYSEKYTEALALLEKFVPVATKKQMDINDYLEYYLLKSRLYHRMNNFEFALSNAKIVKKHFDDDNNYNKNSASVMYLKKYLFFVLSKIYYSLDDQQYNSYSKLYKETSYPREQSNETISFYKSYAFPLPKVDSNASNTI